MRTAEFRGFSGITPVSAGTPGAVSCSWFESRYPSFETPEIPGKSDSTLLIASDRFDPR